VNGRAWVAALAVVVGAAACGTPQRADSAAQPSPRLTAGADEFCGKEVRDCDLDYSNPIPAGCNDESYDYAIEQSIDAGYFPFDEIGCDGKYLALRVDLGADACPPEATEEEREQCARMKTAYFVERDGTWDLITYEERTHCSYVQSIEPSFPSRLCEPGGGRR
jgi:hypothetical protein